MGASITSIKAEEARLAVDMGSDEIDMVIAIGLLKSKKYDEVIKMQIIAKDMEAKEKAYYILITHKFWLRAIYILTMTGFLILLARISS